MPSKHNLVQVPYLLSIQSYPVPLPVQDCTLDCTHTGTCTCQAAPGHQIAPDWITITGSCIQKGQFVIPTIAPVGVKHITWKALRHFTRS